MRLAHMYTHTFPLPTPIFIHSFYIHVFGCSTVLPWQLIGCALPWVYVAPSLHCFCFSSLSGNWLGMWLAPTLCCFCDINLPVPHWLPSSAILRNCALVHFFTWAKCQTGWCTKRTDCSFQRRVCSTVSFAIQGVTDGLMVPIAGSLAASRNMAIALC